MLRLKSWLLALAALPAPALAQPTTPTAAGCGPGAPLHVASPEWRDQVIYFLMLDRFNDGDKARNELGLGEYRPNEEVGYSGGDLQGVIDKLDYVRALGATAIWTTPPFANQWWSREAGASGSHGYWPRDFTKVDEHYGDMGTYRSLACQLHRRNMFLVMDIVVNHTGDFFDYDKSLEPRDPAAGYRRVSPASPSDAPLTPPFDRNDPRDPAQARAGIYNWTPILRDYYQRDNELRQQLGGLDDINTINPAVRAAFKQIYGRWIADAGVDAFRIDTVKYVEPEFFTDFLYGPGGIEATARASGRERFLSFGEVKENAPAFSGIAEDKMRAYLKAPSRPGLPSLINFPLQEEMVRVLAQGAPTSALTDRLQRMLALYPDPTLATNFVDNHDVPRLRSQGSSAALRQSAALMFAVPGIPIIYQGDEQEFLEAREAMFKGGYLAHGDRFDTTTPMFNYFRALADLRRAHPALRRGTLRVLADNPTTAGGFALLRESPEEKLLFVLNSADRPSLFANVLTGLAPGTRLDPVFGGGTPEKVRADGTITLALAPRAVGFYVARAPLAQPEPAPAAELTLATPVPGRALRRPFVLTGRYRGPDATLRFVRDGDLARATDVPVAPDGRWRLTLPVADYGRHRHGFELYAPIAGIATPRAVYTTDVPHPRWQVAVTDPAGDDTGPDGGYIPPTEPGFEGRMDLLGARLRGGGGVLQLELEMREISREWQPSNGFDHVAFAIFLAQPGTPGLSRYDELNAPMPAGFDWSLAHILFGWGNSIIRQPEEKLGAAPTVAVDLARRTITITYRASALGLKDWRDVRLYVTTYDRRGEGDVRPLTREGGGFSFRGDPAGPKVLDSMTIDLAGRVR